MLASFGSVLPPEASSTAWLVKKEAKAVISVTTKSTTPRTMALPHAMDARFGIEAKVVRMDPVEYSEVTIKAPRTPTTISLTKEPD